jgi:hypothetical protein
MSTDQQARYAIAPRASMAARRVTDGKYTRHKDCRKSRQIRNQSERKSINVVTPHLDPSQDEDRTK